MAVERLVHPDALSQFRREVKIFRVSSPDFQLFVHTEFEQIYKTQPNVDAVLCQMLEDGARLLPGFKKMKYALGYLFAHHTIRKSLEATGNSVPTISQETCHQGSINQLKMLKQNGTETMLRYVINEATTLMPELIQLFKNIHYPMSFELYWGIADVASLFAIELGLDKQDQN